MTTPIMRYAMFATLIFLCTVGAGLAQAEQPAKAAQVNGKAISYADFQRQFEMAQQRVMRGKPGKMPENIIKELRTRVVNQMIAEELLFQESEKQGVQVPPESVEKELDIIKSRFDDPEKFEATLKEMQITEDALREQIVHKSAIKMLIGKEIASKIEVSEQEARSYFEENTEKFRRPERVRARHILVKVNTDDDAQKKADARQKLEDIKKKLLSGEDFAELAKTYSEGPSNARGGDLGYFQRGQMVKSFEDTAFALAPNEISDIVETQFGYHLIKVIDHQAQKDPAFDEIKKQLIQLMHRNKVQQELEPYVAKLRDQAKVETFIQ